MRAEADLSPDFAVAVVTDDGEVVVRVCGEVDGATAPIFRKALIDAQAAHATTVPNERLVVDMSAVTFLGATGLGVLAGASVRARQARREVVLRDPTPMVMRLLEITGLVKVFRLERTSQLLSCQVA